MSQAPDPRRNHVGRAAGWQALSAVGFAGMSALSKRVDPLHLDQVTPMEVVFFRGFVNCVLIAFAIALLRAPFSPGRVRADLKWLGLRSLAGFVGAICLFTTLAHLPVPIAMMLQWSSPLFVLAFSWLFLRERIGVAAWLATLIALFGLTLLLEADRFVLDVDWAARLGWVMIGLLGAAAGGAAYLAVRTITARLGIMRVIFYFTLVTSLGSLPAVIAQRLQVGSGYSLATLGVLVLVGMSATIGQFGLTLAYASAPAPVVSCLGLMSPIFGALLGQYWLDEHLSTEQWFGLLFVIAGVMGAVWANRSRTAARPAAHTASV